ncbi:hypothetical protein A2U01_0108247, partial [Trifolium medium]|nr:hypothetical protein [Trifolium medium]
ALSLGLAQRGAGDAKQKISILMASPGEHWRLARLATKSFA